MEHLHLLARAELITHQMFNEAAAVTISNPIASSHKKNRNRQYLLSNCTMSTQFAHFQLPPPLSGARAQPEHEIYLRFCKKNELL